MKQICMAMVNLNKGIAVDAAHSMKNGKTEYQGVDLETGEIIFYRDLGNQTINIGEFLALVEGIKYVIEHKVDPPRVFSDSVTAISWVKHKATSSNKKNKDIDKAVIYLRTCAIYVGEVEIVKWDNKIWGEIPADFCRK